jgi:hypothetical protein
VYCTYMVKPEGEFYPGSESTNSKNIPMLYVKLSFGSNMVQKKNVDKLPLLGSDDALFQLWFRLYISAGTQVICQHFELMPLTDLRLLFLLILELSKIYISFPLIFPNFGIIKKGLKRETRRKEYEFLFLLNEKIVL